MTRRPLTALLALACAAAAAGCGDTDGGSALPCVSVTPTASTGGGLPGVPSLPGGMSSAPAGGASSGADCVRSQLPSADVTSLLSAPPTAAPPELSGRFRLTVVGFRAVRETTDHALSWDGKKDEVRIRAKTQAYDLTGPMGAFRDVDGRVMGDVNNDQVQVQAGGDSPKGGIRTGDVVQGCCELPLELWQGELRAGRDAVAVVPMLWEIDHTPDGDMTQPDWRASMSSLAPTVLSGAANAVRSRLNLPRLGVPLPGPLDPNATAAIGELLDTLHRDQFKVRRNYPGIGGRAGDRPIGFVNALDNRERQDYFPRIVTLTYETALLGSRTDLGGRGAGSFTVEFREPSADWLEGHYELFLRIEQL